MQDRIVSIFHPPRGQPAWLSVVSKVLAKALDDESYRIAARQAGRTALPWKTVKYKPEWIKVLTNANDA